MGVKEDIINEINATCSAEGKPMDQEISELSKSLSVDEDEVRKVITDMIMDGLLEVKMVKTVCPIVNEETKATWGDWAAYYGN